MRNRLSEFNSGRGSGAVSSSIPDPLTVNVLNVNNTLNSNGTSNFVGISSFYSNISITGNLDLSGSLIVNGDTFLKEDLEVTGTIYSVGSAYLSGGLWVDDSTVIDDSLTVTGETHTNTLVVDGLTTLRSGLELTGNLNALNNLTVAGNGTFKTGLFVTGTTDLTNALIANSYEILRGNLFITGNIYQGTNSLDILQYGYLQSCSVGDLYGISTAIPYTGSALNFVSKRLNGSNNSSFRFVADTKTSAISESHKVISLGWEDSSNNYNELWNFRKLGIFSGESASIEALGEPIDGTSAVGTYVGTINEVTNSSARLFSVINSVTSSTNEKMFVNSRGETFFCISPYGGYTCDKYLSSNELMIPGQYTNTVLNIPAGAQLYAVAVRVTNSIPISGTFFPSSSLFSVGISASSGYVEKWGLGIPTTAGSTNLTSSLKNGIEYYSVNTPIGFRFDNAVSGISSSYGSGSIRVEIRYREVIPPLT